MCFSIPKKIVKIKNNIATLLDGTSVFLGNVKANKNDYVTIYGQTVIEKINKKDAIETLKLIRESTL